MARRRSGRLTALATILILIGAAGLGAVCVRWEVETRLEFRVAAATCRQLDGYAVRVWEQGRGSYGDGEPRPEWQREQFLAAQSGVWAEASIQAVWTRKNSRRSTSSESGAWTPEPEHRLANQRVLVFLPDVESCALLQPQDPALGVLDWPCCDALPNDDLFCSDRADGSTRPRIRLVDVKLSTSATEP